MQLPNDPLELAILLYESVEQRLVVGRTVEGLLPPSFDLPAVVQLLDSHELLVSDDPASRRIEFYLPHKPDGIFFCSMTDLLAGAERRQAVPARFYVAELRYLHSDNSHELPEPVQCYFDAVRLFQALKRIADHVISIGTGDQLVFLQREKLLLSSAYRVEDLTRLPFVGDFEREFVDAAVHGEQKATIVRTAVVELFRGHKSADLGELLRCFDELLDRVQGGYDLYVAEFSFQKVKSEVEKDKLEFTSKLNKVFSDIQNQLLAVPAALVLVGGQLEAAGHWATKNVLIWLGVLVFAVLMNLLVRNQRNTLVAVKHEIDQQWQQIEGKYKAVADRFSESYKQLDQRYRHQEWLIRTVSGLVAVALGTTTGMLLWYSVSSELMITSLRAGLIAGCVCLVMDALLWLWQRYRKPPIQADRSDDR